MQAHLAFILFLTPALYNFNLKIFVRFNNMPVILHFVYISLEIVSSDYHIMSIKENN